MKIRHGFTVIEMLVVTTIFIVAALTVSQILISTVMINTKVKMSQLTKEAGDVTMDAITRHIQNATAVNARCTSSGATNNGLILTERQIDDTLVDVTLGCVNEGVFSRIVTSDGTTIRPLNSDKTTLVRAHNGMNATSCGSSLGTSPLVFTCISDGTTPRKILVQFSLAAVGETGIISGTTLDFASDVNLRNQVQ